MTPPPVAAAAAVPLGRAALWMGGAIAAFSAMAVAGRAVSLELDTFEIMTYRSLVGLALVLTVASAAGTLREVTRDRLGLHLLRNLCHFAGQNLWFYAIAVIPLAQVFALEFTSPIWVALLAPLVLAERLTRARMAAVVLGFLGIVLITRPGTGTLSPGVLAAAAAAIGFAGTALATKLLTRSAGLTCILFWLTAMQAVFGLICAGIDGRIALPSAAALPWVVLIGCAGLTAHYCLTSALRLAPAGLVMPMDFLRLPVIALVGAWLYAEPLDPMVLLGAGLILGGNALNLAQGRRAPQSSAG